MTRFFGCVGATALLAALVFALAGMASDPPDELPPIKKLDPGAADQGTKPSAPPKKVDNGKEPELLRPQGPDAAPQAKDPPKLKTDGPLEPLKGQEKVEDPKEIIARVVENMGSSDDRLKKGKTGNDTQTIQKKIIEDLEKLINQQQKDKKDSDCDCEKGNKKNDDASKKPNQGDGSAQKDEPGKGKSQGQSPQSAKNNQTKPDGSKGSGEPKPGVKEQSDPKQQKTGDPTQKQQKQEPGQVTKQEDKDKKGDGTKVGLTTEKGAKDAKAADNTVSGLVKDVWGHLPKAKRLEMDAYSREQFMPQYEQLLRQYYQTIAAQGKKKEGE
jgi:hypothetical protein